MKRDRVPNDLAAVRRYTLILQERSSGIGARYLETFGRPELGREAQIVQNGSQEKQLLIIVQALPSACQRTEYEGPGNVSPNNVRRYAEGKIESFAGKVAVGDSDASDLPWKTGL